MHWIPEAFVFLHLLRWHVNSFNADLKSIKSFKLPGSTARGDYFGYSLALHNSGGGKWLLVGAPLSNEGSSERSGNVYRCPLSTTGACTRMNIDSKGASQIVERQWLGANIHSGGPQKNIVTCAPRLKDTPPSRIWLHGKCILLDGKNFAVRKTINPCQTRRNSQYGYCQAGISATITGNGGPYLMMGMTGYRQFLGQVGLINIDRLKPTGQEDDMEGTSIDRLVDGDYMGYSVAWGNFSGGSLGDVVGGAPRSSDLRGKVIMYSLPGPLTVSGVLENPEAQTGSYFGAAVAAIDLNKDGRSDLLVGAPFYSVNRDEGKVYLYLNNGQGAMNLISPHLRPESRPGARFGTSIAPIGDANRDGYNDFVVGAPFGGPDGKGAVYIYHGGPDGLKNEFNPIQIIRAADVTGGLSAFGISVSGGLDVDNNGYPDFAVGSYISEHAHLIRSKGVLKLSGTITLNATRIPVATNKSHCTGPDGKAYTCVKMDTCLNYSGDGVPATAEVTVQLSLDLAQAGEKRAFFFVSGRRLLVPLKFNVQLKKEERKCSSQVIYAASSNVKDYNSPIQINMQYDYVTPATCGSSLCPVMDKYLGRSTTSELFYLKGCGSDNICNADLVLQATYALPGDSKELLFGVVDTFVITATVENKKENAFRAELLVDYPSDFLVVGAEAQDGGTLLWDADVAIGRLTVSLGSPFQPGRKMVIRAKFAPGKKRPTQRVQKFVVKTKTASKDVNENNNIVTLQVNAALLADITITGSATPDTIFYSPNEAKDKENVKTIPEIGPMVNYTFLIQNKGPSTVEQLKVRVSITSLEKDNYLLYLLGARIDGTLACNVKTNPANLTANTGSKNNGTTPNRRRRSVDRLDCRTAICTSFDCKIGRLQKGQSVTLRLYTRVWEHTLKQRGEGSVDLIVKSVLEVPKEELEFLRQPEDAEPDSKEVVLRVNPPAAKETKEKSEIPWWVILLAVLGGLLLLAIPTAIMYKRGFFKRDRRIKEITGPSGGADDVE